MRQDTTLQFLTQFIDFKGFILWFLCYIVSFNTKYLMQEIDVNFLCNSMMNMVLWKNEKPYCCRNVVCISFDVKNKKGVSNIFLFVLSRYNSKGVLMSRELLIILDNLYIAHIHSTLNDHSSIQMQLQVPKWGFSWECIWSIKSMWNVKCYWWKEMATPIFNGKQGREGSWKSVYVSLSCVAFVCRDPLIKTSLRPISLL